MPLPALSDEIGDCCDKKVAQGIKAKRQGQEALLAKQLYPFPKLLDAMSQHQSVLKIIDRQLTDAAFKHWIT